ncbi:division/cell wall cluster transcriptional repressor MraZ [soil metagenome]
MSFTGEFRRTIDTKGRLIVPASMRGELEDDTAILVVSPDGCIEMYSGPGWRDYEAKLLDQRRSNSTARAVVRRIAASARSDQVDRQGRLHLPDHLRAWAGIEREVTVVGAFDHAELWEPERWDGAAISQDGLQEGFGQLEM